MTALPPRFTVPPLPPRIHRRLTVALHDDGVTVTPESGPGVLVHYAVKGKIETIDCDPGEVIIGAAYLLVFMPRTGAPLFPGHIHEVYTLDDIHPIPLSRDLAPDAIKRLLDLQVSRQPKGKSRWSLALPIRSDPEVLEEEAPEADESPMPKREWKNFMPKLRKKTEKSETISNDPPQREELESKIVRQIIREFSSGFFFSYDLDLTHSLQHKRRVLAQRTATQAALADLIPKSGSLFPSPPAGQSRHTAIDDDFVEPDVQVPLWRRVDGRFFWNEFLMKDFIDLGLHAFVIPMMQGWVQSSSFTIPIPPNPLDPTTPLGAVPVDLVVISRRSRDRAGLRYQRRGIDNEGHVANMVETEMIVRAKAEEKTSLFSFVQVRGSIPLRWSQSPYSMKPPPVLNEPVDQSYAVANLHFNDLTSRYGPILHDGVSSLSRMFYGAVSDFFAQAVISFFLGHRNLSVFSEFLETLSSADASSVEKLSRVRAAATVYVVSFNYSLEKVIEFTRIPTASITSVQKGPYILSTLQEASRDPKENYGFIVNFSPADESTRYSTYSLRNRLPMAPPSAALPSTPQPSVEHASINPDLTEYYAFKAIPGYTGDEGNCQEVVDHVVDDIDRVCKRDDLVVEQDIVSLAEAAASTSILDKMDYAFKRFLWL
ncbi:hypothetical protein IAU60_005760 [Kwoniella sp. DSM 27419]